MNNLKVFYDVKQKQLIFENDDEVMKYSEKFDKICLIYDQNVLDVTGFLSKHPGGSSILEDYCGYDIEEIFNSPQIHMHSKNAHTLVSKYIVGIIDEDLYKEKVSKNQLSIIKIANHLQWRDIQIDLQSGIVSQIIKLSSQQYKSFLCNGKELKKNYQLSIDETNNSIVKLRFYDDVKKENSLWLSNITIIVIKLLIAAFCFIHLQFNYVIIPQQLFQQFYMVYILAGISIGFLMNQLEEQIYESINSLYILKFDSRQYLTREFHFLMYSYQLIFGIERYVTIVSLIPQIFVGLVNVLIFMLFVNIKIFVLYISLGQLICSSLKTLRQSTNQQQDQSDPN